jgi:hypothetical protein
VRHTAILSLAIIIVDEVFSQDKNQKVTPRFMQGGSTQTPASVVGLLVSIFLITSLLLLSKQNLTSHQYI